MSDSEFPIAFTARQQRKIYESEAKYQPKHDMARLPQFGIVTKFETRESASGGALMVVWVRVDNIASKITQESYARPFILGHTAEEIALIYGDTLVGKRCKIDFFGARNDQGIVTLVHTSGEGDLEEAHNVPDFGTILAPAGGGLI